MATGGIPISNAKDGKFNGTIDSLVKIDGTTGAAVSNISLSSPIQRYYGRQSMVLSGRNRVVIYVNGTVSDIALPSGTVTVRQYTYAPDIQTAETWAAWGVAEYWGGDMYMVYKTTSSGGNKIVRTQVGTGTTTDIYTFTATSELASFTVSIADSRWYFHYENEYPPLSPVVYEALGYADATFQTGPGANDFKILTLTTDAAYVIDVQWTCGDDRCVG